MASYSREHLRLMIGTKGIIVKECSPLGYVTIDGRIYEALSKYVFIPRERMVKVIGVDFNQLIVEVI